MLPELGIEQATQLAENESPGIFIALREGFWHSGACTLEPPGKEGFKVLQGRLMSVFWGAMPCGNRGSISPLDLRLIVEVSMRADFSLTA